MFVIFHRLKLKLSWYSVRSREILILMLLMIIQKSQSETHWACVPDPPVLHPAVWKGKDIAVTVNDTHLLDQPATQKFLIDWTFDVLI